MNVHITQEGRQLGPFSPEQIHKMIKTGAISPESLAWTEGQPEWKPLKDIMALIPPPLPPGGILTAFRDSKLAPNSTQLVAVDSAKKTASEQPKRDSQAPASPIGTNAPQNSTTVIITATSARQACEQIQSHVAPLLEQGWSIQQGFALVGGWKNSYTLTRGSEQRVLEFDLRPTLASIPSSERIVFTTASLCIGQTGLKWTEVLSAASQPRESLLTRSQWRYRVREAEMALEAIERKRGAPSALERMNLERMKANPPKEYAPEPSGFKLLLGRLLVSMFPGLIDGIIMNAWKAGRPPRPAPNPPGVDDAARKVLNEAWPGLLQNLNK